MHTTLPIAENENNLKKILSVVNEVSNTYGLKINVAKTKTVVMHKGNKKNHFIPVSVSINENGVEQIRSFIYSISVHVLLMMENPKKKYRYVKGLEKQRLSC